MGTQQSQTRATWISSIVAALALVVSVFALYESHEARVSTVKDNVVILVSRYTGDYPLVVNNASGPLLIGAAQALWEILISNTGASTISLTGYEIFQISQQGGEIQYSGIEQGLFSSESLAKVNLPISLDAGKSIKLILKVGITPGESAYKALSSVTVKGEKPLMLHAAEKILASSKIDIYDNEVIPFSDHGEVIGWRVEKQGKEQIFLVRLRTARGTEISNLTSWYDLKKLQ